LLFLLRIETELDQRDASLFMPRSMKPRQLVITRRQNILQDRIGWHFSAAPVYAAFRAGRVFEWAWLCTWGSSNRSNVAL